MSGALAGRLEFPHVRHYLILELAKGTKTQIQLAGELGVDSSSISTFRQRHHDEIEACIANHLDELTGIVLADKATRLSVYQDLIEKLSVPTPKMAGKEYVIDPADGKVVREIDAGAIIKALRAMAEELGQLPTRMVITGDVGVRTNYTVNGVDPGNLK